jgi:transcriptional regulator with XRE-family HTH domain
MKANEFDIRVADVLRAFRVLANEKQANLAKLIDVTQPEYSRIEKGERALTLGHLHIICKHLKISMAQVIFFAEATIKIDFQLTPLSVILSKFASLVEEKDLKLEFNDKEIHFIFEKIKMNKLPNKVPSLNG